MLQNICKRRKSFDNKQLTFLRINFIRKIKNMWQCYKIKDLLSLFPEQTSEIFCKETIETFMKMSFQSSLTMKLIEHYLEGMRHLNNERHLMDSSNFQ